LSEQNAEKDKFFSIIAHDLRGPFNVLLGFTQLLEEELPSFSRDEIQKFATNMRKSADKLFLLLENLLEWSLIQRGLRSFKPELFCLADEISTCVEMVRHAAEKKQILISQDIPESLILTADKQMFESLIRNLVFNATKFTPKGGTISLAAALKPGDYAEISIRDTGIGMDQNTLDKLFRLDGQIHRSGTEGEPSTGLGLIICRDFIEKHGGKLWAESEENKGSTFFFTIPCNPNQTIVPENRSATTTQPLASKQNKNLKILIAEDDETSEILLSIAIKPFGRQIFVVNTGADAVDTCRNNPDLDLILMDVKMPGLDGLEATRQIRVFNKDVIIIAQTAYGHSDDRDEALAAGCTDFIAKPFDILSLRELLHKYFSG
jgi:CheY-like chemotaxis protein